MKVLVFALYCVNCGVDVCWTKVMRLTVYAVLDSGVAGAPKIDITNNFQLFYFFASATVPTLSLTLAVFSQWNKNSVFWLAQMYQPTDHKTVWILFSPSSYSQPPQLAHLVSVKHGCSLMCLGCHYTTVMCVIVKILREHSWGMSSLDAWTINHLQVSIPNPVCGTAATLPNLLVCQW